MGINGSGSPVTAIAAVGFMAITSAAAGGIVLTPAPVIVITAIGIAAMIAGMIAGMIAEIAATIAGGIAIRSWR